MKKISLIVTCYNEEKNIEELISRTLATFKKLPYSPEIIFIDNFSTDNSRAVFKKAAKRYKFIKVLFMSRNFGSPQPSLIAGINHMTGDAAVFLHGDIQDPPEILPKFISLWERGYEVVYGMRTKREGYGMLMNFFYKSFYFLLRKLSYLSFPLHAGDFSLVDKKVIEYIKDFDEYDYHFRGIRAYVGFRQIGLPYIREARHYGRSQENFFSNLWWAKTILINFSFRPLELISMIAFIVMIFTFILLFANVVLLFLFQDSPRGIPTIIFVVLFLGGVQLLCLSVIAEYLAKIFLEVKRRPRYVIKDSINIPKKIVKDKYA
jgi:polyisoprenyl-phosphate glycosyltransferase